MPDRVPPEIENLRDCATRPDGGSLTQFEAFIPLADAEAAVLACEKRMGDEQRCGAEPPAACHCDCPQPCAECAAVNEPETDT